jgi:hypothetical protein
MPGGASGCSWPITWTPSLIRRRWPAGWPPRPGGNAAAWRAQRRDPALGDLCRAPTIPAEQARTVEHELLAAERHAALRDAFLHLPLSRQRLITMLIEDPRAPYAEISAKLGIPVAAIGPARSRCLDELRRHPAIAALIRAEAETARCDAGPGPVHPKC